MSDASKLWLSTPPVRPKSAGVASRTRPTTVSDPDACKGARRTESPGARILKTRTSTSCARLEQQDQFCTQFKSPRPRPPSASSTAIVVLSNNGRARRVRIAGASTAIPRSATTTLEHDSSDTSTALAIPTNVPGVAHTGGISQHVLKEEIETQRCVTRQAQKQLYALQHELAEKKKEIELVKRHLAAFEAQAMTSSSSATSAFPLSSARHNTHMTGTSSTVGHPATATLPAGDEVPGTGARHREITTTASCLPENEGTVAGGRPMSVADRLKDQVQRQDLYKKKLKNLLERLGRHLQFSIANLEALQHKNESTRRELSIFHDKVVQERNRCRDLELKKHELLNQSASQAHNAVLVLNSLREEIASRSAMSRQRDEADRRREQLLTLIQSKPPTRGSSRVGSTDRGAVTLGTTGRRSTCMNSIHLLSTAKAQHDLAPAFFSAEIALKRSPSQHRNHPIDKQHFVHHETFMQIYEEQYARVLEETHESDLSVVIERFMSFKETKRHLLQIESDASEQSEQLERERETHSDLVRKLRVSGIAEVEKRKKIRDFLEQMYHVKTQAKSQAKDKFVDQLKIFSFVQQGIRNIVELFRCLDDRVTPPDAVLASPLSAADSPASVAHALEDIVRFCVQVARLNPGGPPIVFTDAQVESLREFIVSDVAPKGSPSKPQSELVETSVSVLKTGKSRSDGDRSSAHTSASPPRRAMAIKNAVLDAAVAKSNPQLISPWTAKFPVPPVAATAIDSEYAYNETENEADDESVMVSSESDTEETRRDMKRSEKDTLQQVEALLKTFDTRQILLNREAHAPDTASTPKLGCLRSGERHGSVHLLPGADEGIASDVSLTTIQRLASSKCGDNDARLEAVHTFFREKRRRERQEQQQQREMLARLVEAAYNTNQRSADDTDGNSITRQPHLHSSSEGPMSSRDAGSPNRFKFMSTTPRKRNNGAETVVLHSTAKEQQQQQQQQRQAGSRRPLRPKTVR